jgi:hypothetical protein
MAHDRYEVQSYCEDAKFLLVFVKLPTVVMYFAFFRIKVAF